MPDFEYVIRRFEQDVGWEWIQSIVDSESTTKPYPGDTDTVPTLYTTVNSGSLSEPEQYPGDLWAYRGLKIELQYLYFDHISGNSLTNGVVEAFFFDGSTTLDVETIQPCTNDTLLNDLLEDFYCDDNTYLNNRIFAAQWCGNDNSTLNCTSQNADIWFDLQHSLSGQSPPYLQDIPFDYSTASWDSTQCIEEINCWGWEGDYTGQAPNNIEPNPIFNSQFNGSIDGTFSDWSSSLKKYSGLTPEDYFYIIVRFGAADQGRNWLGNSYQRFAIPKNVFKNLILNKQEEIIVAFGNNGTEGFNSGNIDITDKIGEPDVTFARPALVFDSSPTYWINALAIKITPPSDDAYDITNGINLPSEWNLSWHDSTSDLNPNDNNIDYTSLSLYSTEQFGSHYSFTDGYIEDFRPISNIFITWANNDYSLQRFYNDDGFLYNITSAPLTVSVTIDISDQIHNIDILNEELWSEDVNSDHINNYEIGYKFRVVQWGDEDDLYDDDDDYFIDSYDDIDEVDFPYQNVRLGPDFPGELQHTYVADRIGDDPYFYIKIFVFSYIYHPLAANYTQALKWKIITAKVNINGTSELFHTRGLEDFGALGGADFITIPWPHPGSTPVISGISDRSKYKKSLAMLSRGGRYESQDDPDYIFTKTANRNDELGDYLGKTDIEQVRVFNKGSYDMHSLLEINPLIGGWTPYSDDSWWDGNSSSSSFTDDTSAGELYVDENKDNDLRNDCILELNLGDAENGTIRDTSGSGNKGMLLGDYSLEKIDKNLPTMRDSAMIVSEVGEDDKAL